MGVQGPHRRRRLHHPPHQQCSLGHILRLREARSSTGLSHALRPSLGFPPRTLHRVVPTTLRTRTTRTRCFRPRFTAGRRAQVRHQCPQRRTHTLPRPRALRLPAHTWHTEHPLASFRPTFRRRMRWRTTSMRRSPPFLPRRRRRRLRLLRRLWGESHSRHHHLLCRCAQTRQRRPLPAAPCPVLLWRHWMWTPRRRSKRTPWLPTTSHRPRSWSPPSRPLRWHPRDPPWTMMLHGANATSWKSAGLLLPHLLELMRLLLLETLKRPK